MEILRKTLVLLEWCSGQKVNWEKSAICGISIEERMIIETDVIQSWIYFSK